MKDTGKILIIDDEKSFTDVMRLNLLDEGFDVRVENDSKKAVDAALEYHPDVILLDIVMPDIDGCDILNTMKTHPELQTTPTILISALVSNREVGDETGMQTPNGMVMAKPVRFEKLRERISEALATAAH